MRFYTDGSVPEEKKNLSVNFMGSLLIGNREMRIFTRKLIVPNKPVTAENKHHERTKTMDLFGRSVSG